MHATTTSSSASTAQPDARRLRWRVVDIVVASVIGVAVGIVFWVWGVAWGRMSAPIEALLPGLQAGPAAVWLIAGVLGGLIIRKPGAAVYTEVVAATVSALIGTQWGWLTIEAGIVQGLGAELVFALFLYRNWRAARRAARRRRRRTRDGDQRPGHLVRRRRSDVRRSSTSSPRSIGGAVLAGGLVVARGARPRRDRRPRPVRRGT